jgi:predicted ATPase
VPHTVKVNSNRRGNKLALEFVQDWGRSKPVKLEAFGMSDGTLRALGLLVAVFQRPVPSVLVIEEPDATMHPGALGAVLDLLRHAGRSAQVIVTTHNLEVLDAKWIRKRHLRMMTWDAGVSRVARVSAATRETLRKQLAGAGELLRSNALTAEELPPPPHQNSLFRDLT